MATGAQDKTRPRVKARQDSRLTDRRTIGSREPMTYKGPTDPLAFTVADPWTPSLKNVSTCKEWGKNLDESSNKGLANTIREIY